MNRRARVMEAADLKRQLGVFAEDDLVFPIAAGMTAMVGSVVRVDKKIGMVFVNWGDGLEKQHTPDEIALHLMQGSDVKKKMSLPNDAVRELRASKEAGSRRAGYNSDVTQIASQPPEDQYVGDPETHGLDTPRGGGFSIMQNLQKDLSKEILQESKDGPKIAPQKPVEIVDGGQGEDQNTKMARVSAIVENLTTTWNDDGSIDEMWEGREAVRVAKSPHVGDEVRFEGDDGLTTVDTIFDVFGRQVEIEREELVFDKSDLRWRGRFWEVTASSDCSDFSGALPRVASRITVYYTSVDDTKEKKTFTDLKSAREYAQGWIGERPDIGSFYAVSSDGVGKIEVDGIDIYQLFDVQDVLNARRIAPLFVEIVTKLTPKVDSMVVKGAKRRNKPIIDSKYDMWASWHYALEGDQMISVTVGYDVDKKGVKGGHAEVQFSYYGQRPLASEKTKVPVSGDDGDLKLFEAALKKMLGQAERTFDKNEKLREEGMRAITDVSTYAKRNLPLGERPVGAFGFKGNTFGQTLRDMKDAVGEYEEYKKEYPENVKEYNEIIKKVKAILKIGDRWDKATGRTASENLKSRRAMYWGDKGRVYRLTKREQSEGSNLCPSCKKDMEKQRFTRNEKLLSCPECGFKVQSGKVIKNRPKIEIEVSPDGEVEVEVTTARRGSRVAANSVPNLRQMSISEIASVISSDWAKINVAAKPYLKEMFGIESVNDMVGLDDGRTMVVYFLANANQWHGGVAKAVKAELKRRAKS